MKKGCLLLLLVPGLFLLWPLIFPDDPAERFVKGVRVVPALQGDWLAVEETEGAWAVLDSSGIRKGEIQTQGRPIWLDGGRGGVLVYRAEGGLWKETFGEKGKRRCIDENPLAWPLEALGQGLLVGYAENRSAPFQGFAVLPFPAGEERRVHSFDGFQATSLKAAVDGRRVSYTEAEGKLFRLTVLVWDEVGENYQPETTWDLLESACHFWSPGGRFLLYATQGGGADLYDFVEGERRWVTQHAFAADPSCSFRTAFGHLGDFYYLALKDLQGYRQINRFESVAGQPLRFSSGWLDHYSPVLSNKSRYLAFCQGHLEPKEGSGEEAIVLYHFDARETRILCERPFQGLDSARGPVFGHQDRFIYFTREGCIYRVALNGNPEQLAR